MNGTTDIKRYAVLNLPYVLVFWFFNKLAGCYRLCAGTDMVIKAMGALSGFGAAVRSSPFPSFHSHDLLFGLAGAAVIRAVVYFKGKNAKKFRCGVEYGSARCVRSARGRRELKERG